MLAAALVAASCSAYVGPVVGPATRRAPGLRMMAAEKKVIQMEDLEDGLFEVREVDIKVPPVYLLSGLENLKVATAVSEAGLLSTAEDLKVFSTLEGLGAFSLAEKALPTIEKLKLLSLFENCLNVPNGFLFTGALTLITFPPNLLLLQGFGIVPFVQLPKGPLIGVELAVDVVSLTAGIALFALATAVGKLQEVARD